MTKQAPEYFDQLVIALLAIQKALLGAIVPSLRAVTVDLDIKKKELFFSFYYDGHIPDDLLALTNTIISKARSKFSKYKIHNNIQRLDYPEKIPIKSGRYAYLRKESDDENLGTS